MTESSVAIPSFSGQMQQIPQDLQMDEIMKSVLAGLPAFQEIMQQQAEDNKSASDTLSHTASSQSDRLSHSPSPDQGEAGLNENAVGQETSVIRETSSSASKENADQGFIRENWYQCFSSQRFKEVEALVYSLFAAPKMEKKGDGYEHYECLNRARFKCRFRLRVKRINDWFIVEERGAHTHSADVSGGHTQGLAKSIREIVDKSFYEDWPSQLRQERIEQEMIRLGLPPNPRLSRQIDNRVSYLRRVKNLNEVKKLQEQSDSNSMMTSAVSQMMGSFTPSKMAAYNSPFSTPSKVDPRQERTPMKSDENQGNVDFNALLSQLSEDKKCEDMPHTDIDANLILSQMATQAPFGQSSYNTPTKEAPAADFNAILAQLQNQTAQLSSMGNASAKNDLENMMNVFFQQAANNQNREPEEQIPVEMEH